MTKFSKTAKKTRMTTERSSIPTQRHNCHNETEWLIEHVSDKTTTQ